MNLIETYYFGMIACFMAINRWVVFLCFIAFVLVFFVSEEAFAKKGLGSLFRSGSSVVGSNGVKLYGRNVLSAPDLKSCLIIENNIDKAATEVDVKRSVWKIAGKNLDVMRSKIEVIERRVKRDRGRVLYTQKEVDTANKDVDEFNRLVGTYNVTVKSFQSLQRAYNIRIDLYNTLFDDFEVKCVNKSYYEDDMQEAKRAMGQN